MMVQGYGLMFRAESCVETAFGSPLSPLPQKTLWLSRKLDIAECFQWLPRSSDEFLWNIVFLPLGASPSVLTTMKREWGLWYPMK